MNIELINSSGVFNYDAGLLPYRREVHTFVGRPIPVKKNASPSPAEIEGLQRKYIAELLSLWDDVKGTYGAHYKELKIIE